MVELNFDTTGQEELRAGGSSQKLPAGEYTAKIMKSELVPNSKGTGKILIFEFEIIGGQYMGHRLPYNVNWENPNETAVSIGKAATTSIIKACGKVICGNSTELHGIPLTIDVTLEDVEFIGREGNTVKRKRNNIRGFSKLKAQTPVTETDDAPW